MRSILAPVVAMPRSWQMVWRDVSVSRQLRGSGFGFKKSMMRVITSGGKRVMWWNVLELSYSIVSWALGE